MMTSRSYFDYAKRLKRLRQYLVEIKVTGCCIDNPVDILYLTGVKLSKGRLIVLEKKLCLFVDHRYLQLAQDRSAVAVDLLDHALIKDFIKGAGVIAFDSTFTSSEDALKLRSLHRLWEPIAVICAELRSIKDTLEIEKMKKSALLVKQGYRHILKFLKTGVSERQIAWEFEKYCREKGASAMAFAPIVAFGENSAMPHYHPGSRKLKKGDIVLCDLGVVLDDYCSDMTRMFYFGNVDARLIRAEAIVRMAHQAVLQMCRPNIAVAALDQTARAIMKSHGVEDYFLHSLGHGIGLETHEPPIIRHTNKEAVLKSGMVITIEPGLYFPGLGGIRHEDTIVITQEDYENFYAS